MVDHLDALEAVVLTLKQSAHNHIFPAQWQLVEIISMVH